ncbi:MAG: hypothetical protein IJW70_10485 [Clostridia bacterium]|nr:hypothetical protein [Clostridia bacterium]
MKKSNWKLICMMCLLLCACMFLPVCAAATADELPQEEITAESELPPEEENTIGEALFIVLMVVGAFILILILIPILIVLASGLVIGLLLLACAGGIAILPVLVEAVLFVCVLLWVFPVLMEPHVYKWIVEALLWLVAKLQRI